MIQLKLIEENDYNRDNDDTNRNKIFINISTSNCVYSYIFTHKITFSFSNYTKLQDAKKNPRSSTHKQHWTVEEQRHLDELLLKYPPERFEAQRWLKISKELKNRTPQQACSFHQISVVYLK